MKTLLFVLFLISSTAFAKISELATYKDLDLSQIDQDTLVIFDIDNTLIRQNSMIGTHQWGDYIRDRAIRRGMPAKEASELQHKMFGELQPSVFVVPVEAEIPAMLKSLKERGIPHFALTARGPNLRKTTLQQIRILMHDFSQSFPEQKDVTLLGEHLEAGVIFSGSVSKGELLKRILDNSVKPVKKIIFVDDRKYNLDSVEDSLANEPIELISLRYGGADSFVTGFDSKLADMQYSLWLETRFLLPNKDVAPLVSDLYQASAKRFHLWAVNVDEFHPTQCERDLTTTETHPAFDCDYTMGDGILRTRRYEFIRDGFTGGYYFGNW